MCILYRDIDVERASTSKKLPLFWLNFELILTVKSSLSMAYYLALVSYFIVQWSSDYRIIIRVYNASDYC